MQNKPAWSKRAIVGPYACDRRACRKPHQTTEAMYQHGDAFLCEECHEAELGDDDGLCVICGKEPASKGKQTCGNASQKCAKALKRRSEKQARLAEVA